MHFQRQHISASLRSLVPDDGCDPHPQIEISGKPLDNKITCGAHPHTLAGVYRYEARAVEYLPS